MFRLLIVVTNAVERPRNLLINATRMTTGVSKYRCSLSLTRIYANRPIVDSRQRRVDGSRVQVAKIPGEIPRSNAQRHPGARYPSARAIHARRNRHRHG